MRVTQYQATMEGAAPLYRRLRDVFVNDYEPSALREHPTERGSVVPTWNVGSNLLSFRNYSERLNAQENPTRVSASR